jgi:DNA-binding transcriptional ArsR family regulator
MWDMWSYSGKFDQNKYKTGNAMKRNINLIRTILTEIENSDDAYVTIKDIPGYKIEAISYHIYLLNEAGLVEAETEMVDNGDVHLTGDVRLTWEGHEFLDAAKNEKIWLKARSILKKKSIDLPVQILQKLLVKLIDTEVFNG